MENQLEINEGIAEYTGLVFSDRGVRTRRHLANSLVSFMLNPTFERSFFFSTIPVYGFLLSLQKYKWNLEISGRTDLTTYLIKAFNVAIPLDLKIAAEKMQVYYDGNNILKEETRRKTETRIKVSEYQKKFNRELYVTKKINISNKDECTAVPFLKFQSLLM